MKTNQIMRVSIMDGVLQVGHKDEFGSLSDLFLIGNKHRAHNDRVVIRHDKWLSLTSTKEHIAYVSKQIGEPALRTKKGKGGGIWAHIQVLIDAAMYLSPELKYEIISTFINKNILMWRDRSGDKYIELDAAIALEAEKIFGKPAHIGHYVNIAKIIKTRIGVDNWNLATPEDLQERARIEEGLNTMLRMQAVRDWDHLKELAKEV